MRFWVGFGVEFMWTIYCYQSPSEKVYVGQTKRGANLRRREHIAAWQRWVKAEKPARAYQAKLFYAFDAYSQDRWIFSVLADEIETAEEADAIEKEWITFFDSVNNGYNIMAGGHGWKQGTVSDDHKKAQSEARKLYWASSDGIAWKAELSERMKKNKFSKDQEAWNKGKKHSKEHIEAARKGNKAFWGDVEKSSELREKSRKRFKENNPNKNGVTDKQRESSRKVGLSMKGFVPEIVKCPHCDVSGSKSPMSRWHFANCRAKK
jgi:hypothetical protein